MFQLLKLLYYFLLSMIFSSVPLLRLHTQLKSLQLRRNGNFPKNWNVSPFKHFFQNRNLTKRGTTCRNCHRHFLGRISLSKILFLLSPFKKVMAVEICNFITTRQRMLAIQYISINHGYVGTTLLQSWFYISCVWQRCDYSLARFGHNKTTWLGLG